MRNQPNAECHMSEFGAAGWGRFVRFVGRMRILRVLAISGLFAFGSVQQPVQLERQGTLPVPEALNRLGPGSLLRIVVPGETTTYCTAGPIFSDDAGTLYASTAGHCVMPAGFHATHGAGADYNAAGVDVRAYEGDCSSTCRVLRVGEVVFARQMGASGEVGNDFALLRIDRRWWPQVRTSVPTLGGPLGEYLPKAGDMLGFYGQGINSTSLPYQRARYGITHSATGILFQAGAPSIPGDSGAPVLRMHEQKGNKFALGQEVVGILTHGIPGGTIQGTTIARARFMVAVSIGLNINVVSG